MGNSVGITTTVAHTVAMYNLSVPLSAIHHHTTSIEQILSTAVTLICQSHAITVQL